MERPRFHVRNAQAASIRCNCRFSPHTVMAARRRQGRVPAEAVAAAALAAATRPAAASRSRDLTRDFLVAHESPEPSKPDATPKGWPFKLHLRIRGFKHDVALEFSEGRALLLREEDAANEVNEPYK